VSYTFTVDIAIDIEFRYHQSFGIASAQDNNHCQPTGLSPLSAHGPGTTCQMA